MHLIDNHIWVSSNIILLNKQHFLEEEGTVLFICSWHDYTCLQCVFAEKTRWLC